MFRLKPYKEKGIHKLGGLRIPFFISYEYRDSIRVSLGRKKFSIRIPMHLSSSRKTLEVQKALHWLDKKIKENPALGIPFQKSSYQTGDILQVGKKEYRLEIIEKQLKSISGKLKGKTIILQLAQNTSVQQVKNLLSRLVAKDFIQEITERVHALNEKYFREQINVVRLKYNQSNWGSCSSSGNINLSTRLLFAPDHVIDYVIIHELAHLIEMNHSARFYKLVSSAMPEYKQAEQWLKQFGHQCDF